ncbi:unnamed protein product [Didymodactylos carnosus]|uniref:Uncharacterized protein n=1 Tax=Didymodactylos carnosus TaxID=1234261 RepID=A0A816DVX8_9BILA|nr:unnamed protein product [Didymodactylos carnosus]CAF1641789.1 unnamed protein product [Didymodactylos carnosus]CAF3710690.1 unnamed protein product [Didymodactylos carnosus]CAF4554670.1 unnamed protein product [Didymodactylos carnosus]
MQRINSHGEYQNAVSGLDPAIKAEVRFASQKLFENLQRKKQKQKLPYAKWKQDLIHKYFFSPQCITNTIYTTPSSQYWNKEQGFIYNVCVLYLQLVTYTVPFYATRNDKTPHRVRDETRKYIEWNLRLYKAKQDTARWCSEPKNIYAKNLEQFEQIIRSHGHAINAN